MFQVNVIAPAFVKLVGGGGAVGVAFITQSKRCLQLAAPVALELIGVRLPLELPVQLYAVRVQQVLIVSIRTRTAVQVLVVLHKRVEQREYNVAVIEL